jgi:hypothetical protein
MSTMEDKLAALRLVMAAKNIAEARKIAALALGETIEPVGKGLSAEAFFEAWGKAQAAVMAADPRWDLDPDMGGWADRPCGASFRTARGTVIRIPSVIRCPHARYWPGGVLPAGMTITRMVRHATIIEPLGGRPVTAQSLHGVDDALLRRDREECLRLAREWRTAASEREESERDRPLAYAHWFAGIAAHITAELARRAPERRYRAAEIDTLPMLVAAASPKGLVWNMQRPIRLVA